MQISFEEKSPKNFYLGAFIVSLTLHILLAFVFHSPLQAKDKKKDTWVEMTVNKAKPPPVEEVKTEKEKEPEPPKEHPTKPKPKKKPAKKIDFKDIPKEQPKEVTPPPKEKKQVRRVQGLKATSFAKGGNTKKSYYQHELLHKRRCSSKHHGRCFGEKVRKQLCTPRPRKPYLFLGRP